MSLSAADLVNIEREIIILNKKIGLKPETLEDIAKSIAKQRRKLKKSAMPNVLKLSPFDKNIVQNKLTNINKYT